MKKKIFIPIIVASSVIITAIGGFMLAANIHAIGGKKPIQYCIEKITDQKVEYTYTLEKGNGSFYNYSLTLITDKKVMYYHCSVKTGCNHFITKLIDYDKRVFKPDEIEFINYNLIWSYYYNY